MAVNQSFLEKVKMALRISSSDFNSELSDLIEEAILDLTSTADIKAFTTDDADPLQAGAVKAYVAYRWFEDEKYFVMYNDLKSKMALSKKYRSVIVDEEQ